MYTRLFYILFFLSTQCYCQRYIVLRKAQRDSLINILLPQFQNYMTNTTIGKIAIDPIRLQDSLYYVLPVDLLTKPEWKPLYDAFLQAGYIQKLVIRNVADSEFIKPKDPFSN